MSALDTMSDVALSPSTIVDRQADELALLTEGRTVHSVDSDQSAGTIAMGQLPSNDDPKDPQYSSEAAPNEDAQLLDPGISAEMEKEATFFQTFTKEVMDHKDDPEKSFRKVGTASYPSLIPEVIEEERSRLEARSRQAMLHTAYTEFRVKNLEAEVKKLRREVEGLPEDFEIAKSVSNPVYLHELKRSTGPEFRLTEASKTILPRLQPALEVLLAHKDPGASYTKSGEDAGSQQSPRAIRIRPILLSRHLGKISGQSIEPRYHRARLEASQSSAIIIRRPFKLFCEFEKQIRASVAELETQTDKNTKGKVQEITNTKPKMEYDDKDLLTDLKLLLEFLDVDLKSTLELRGKIRDGTATTIEYEDLWHLFKLGDNVIQQSGMCKVYRVINFTVSTRHVLFSLVSNI
ncbi:MAG: hypothetical protein CL912_20720 [Deltaproteobacteria bacterium]|nr:hypothetical protein [Deltaproteobacteria bacterium]